MDRAVGRALQVVVGAALVTGAMDGLPDPAAAAKLRLGARTAAVGQLVAIGGPGVTSTKVRATVGGRTAKVVKVRRKLYLVVPKVGAGSKRVLVRAGRRRLTSKLKVRRSGSFQGKVRVTLDSRRATRASVGPGGGTISATATDGSKFKLAVPAGAIASPTQITLTPIRSLGGLPLTGKGRRAAIQFAPDGLRFLKPAALTISPKGGAPRTSTGFAFDGKGSELTLQRLRRSGKSLVLSIDHFSGAGAAPVASGDFALLVGDLVRRAVAGGALNLYDVDFFISVLKEFERTFGSRFCRGNPTCNFLFEAVRQSLIQLGVATCRGDESRVGSELLACFVELLDIEADMQLLGLPPVEGLAGRRQAMLQRLVDDAEQRAKDDVTGNFANEAELTPRDRKHVTFDDRDKTGRVSNGEWALGIAELAAEQGETASQAKLTDAFETGLGNQLTAGRRRCDEVLAQGKEMLEKGLALAKGQREDEFSTALQECIPKVTVTPATATLQAGAAFAFTARSNTGETAFTWSATGGSITQAGVYTGATQGGQSVTAALASDPSRTGSALVTVVPAGTSFSGTRTLTSIAAAGCSVSGQTTTDDDSSTGSASGNSTIQPISQASLACGSGTSTTKVHALLEKHMRVDEAGVLTLGVSGQTFPDTQRSGTDNVGGTGGIWVIVGASLSANFTLASASAADCTGSFNSGFLDPVTRSLKITDSGSGTVVDVSPTATHVVAGLPAGSYHVEAAGKYQAGSGTSLGSNMTFDLDCTITPA